MHGLADSAWCWLIADPDVAPAFVAARAGYDVWLGNGRGSTYSVEHMFLDPWRDNRRYWDFDWEQ